MTVKPVLDRAADFVALIAGDNNGTSFAELRAAEQTGRPLGTKVSSRAWRKFPAVTSPSRAGPQAGATLLEHPKLL